MDRTEELNTAQTFVVWFNTEKGTDYEVFLNEDENRIDGDVDVYAKSKSGQHRQLNFQIRTGEQNLKRARGLLMSNSELMLTVDADPISQSAEGIAKKEAHYPSDQKKEIVLLLSRTLPGLDEVYAQKMLETFSNSDFKGVYLVRLASEPGMAFPPHGAQVTTVKGIG